MLRLPYHATGLVYNLVMSQGFELTKEGVKLSYVRFLSDSAAGYIFLLLFGVAIVLEQPMPFIGKSWLKAIPCNQSTEVKIFLFFISFLGRVSKVMLCMI